MPIVLIIIVIILLALVAANIKIVPQAYVYVLKGLVHTMRHGERDFMWQYLS